MKKILIIIIILNFFIAKNTFAHGSERVDIHGFISQGYAHSTDNNYLANTKDGTFEFNEIGINFNNWITPDLKVGMQLFARDLGDIGNDEIVVDWAYANYQYKRWLNIQAGKMRSPLGLYGETRDIDMLRTTILLPQGVYNEGWRDSVSSIKGLGVYGTLYAGFMGAFIYTGQLGVVDIPTDGGIGKFIDGQADTIAQYFDMDMSYVAALRWETPLSGLRLGFTGNWFKFDLYTVANDSEHWRSGTVNAFTDELLSQGYTPEQIEGTFGSYPPSYEVITQLGFDLVGTNVKLPENILYYVLSSEYIWENLSLAAEFSQIRAKYSIILTDLDFKYTDNRSLIMEGYYASASYRFLDWLELGMYYSYFCPDTDDRDGKFMEQGFGFPRAVQWIHDYCLAARFDATDNWIIKLEGHAMDGLAVMYIQDQPRNSDGSYDVDSNWFLFSMKATYSF